MPKPVYEIRAFRLRGGRIVEAPRKVPKEMRKPFARKRDAQAALKTLPWGADTPRELGLSVIYIIVKCVPVVVPPADACPII